jgi:hypothetical protein
MRPRTRSFLQATQDYRKREHLIEQALRQQPCTIRDLVTAVRIRDSRVRYSLQCMHAQHRVHIKAWMRQLCPDGKMRWEPVFAAGDSSDAAPPEGVTRKGLVLRIEDKGSQELAAAINHWFRN